MRPVATTPTSLSSSAWSAASWAFFGLTVLATAGIGGYALLYRASAGDPPGGPMMGVVSLAGMGAAWSVALACLGDRDLCGLVGVLKPSWRTAGTWAAVALNAAVVVVSVVLLQALSP
jgi:hypothetical protein